MDLTERAKQVFGAAVVDHSKEFRIFGPPGCGKTTFLSRQIERAVEKVGSENVVVASFTRAAAAEIAGRKLPLDRANVGTLHALAYRALGAPPIAETKLKDWNAFAPMYAMTGEGGADMDEPGFEQMNTGGGVGEELLMRAGLLRAKLVPPALWPVQVAAFYRKWCAFKRETGCIDFTDMIETALADEDEAPGSPSVGFFDEVQDFTPLELALVRKWGSRMGMVLLAGDDDQAIYSFKGATPDAFLNPALAPEQIRVLSQSYRVPSVIQSLAQAWIEKVSRRQEKRYYPKRLLDGDGQPRLTEDGEVLYASGEVRRLTSGKFERASWRAPEPFLEDAMRYVDAGRTVMFLAACSYMLEPLKLTLRQEGIPFHNPYRRKRGDWNPLNPGHGTSTGDRIQAYLRVDPERNNPFWEPGDAESFLWTPQDLQRWIELIKSQGVFRRGAKTTIDRLTGDYPLRASVLHPLFEPDVWTEATGLELEFLAKHALASKAKALEYPLAVTRRYGQESLKTPPKIILGTIHSVKGGEADVVYLFPDLSKAGYDEWSRPGETQDSVRRLFYVGMTRTKDVLALCGPAGPMAVRL